MLHLVSMIFGTSIPTSFNILVKMFLCLYIIYKCKYIADSLSFEECNVEKGGVKVNKLKDVHLGNEAVIILSLGAMEFCKCIITRTVGDNITYTS